MNGFDCFDTARGEPASRGKRKIAAWQLDTDYDGRGLFPRQVFFLMAGKDEHNPDVAKFRDYFDYDEPIRTVPSHRAPGRVCSRHRSPGCFEAVFRP